MKLQKDKDFFTCCETDSSSGSSCNEVHKTKSLLNTTSAKLYLIMQAFGPLTESGIGSQHHRQQLNHYVGYVCDVYNKLFEMDGLQFSIRR